MKKLALIGCGGIGGYHLGHFLQFEDIELAGFCDIIPERAEEYAAKARETAQGKNARAFTCYKDLYDQVQPDMVFICVPPTEHGEMEFETIRRGIHMFVEKPVALTMELARKIRDEIQKAGLIAASGFQLRYDNLVEPVKAYVKEHEVVFIDCARIGGIPGTPWWKKRATSGGQIVEQTIHQFDMIRYVFGEPDTVFTMGTKGFVTGVDGYDTEDLTSTVVKFKSGALATISTGCYASDGAASDSKITFGARDSRLDFYPAVKVNVFGVRPPETNESFTSQVIQGDGTLSRSVDEGAVHYTSHVDYGLSCDRTFVDAVITGDPSKIRSPYADAVKSVIFTLACNQSMDTGLPVQIEY